MSFIGTLTLCVYEVSLLFGVFNVGSQLIVPKFSCISESPRNPPQIYCDKIVSPRNSILNKLSTFSALPFASGSVLLRVLSVRTKSIWYVINILLLLLLLLSLQSCPTLCDPIDQSPPGFPVPGILQARTLEWVAISFSNAWKWKVKVKSLSHVRLLATPWIVAHQTPPSMGFSMGFSRQEYWSGVPLPSPNKHPSVT